MTLLRCFTMNIPRIQKRDHWAEELEDSLKRAIQAEDEGRYESADWLFQRAVFFEAKLREVPDARAYLVEAGYVYEKVKA